MKEETMVHEESEKFLQNLYKVGDSADLAPVLEAVLKLKDELMVVVLKWLTPLFSHKTLRPNIRFHT